MCVCVCVCVCVILHTLITYGHTYEINTCIFYAN